MSRFKSAWMAIAMMAGLSVSAVAQGTPGGCVQGTITGPELDEATEHIMHGRELQRYKTGNDAHDQVPAGYRLSEKAVVYITGISTDPPEDTTLHAVLDQRDMIFRPLVLPVRTGTTVDFPNNDRIFHNVFSYSKTKEFDLGRYAKGKSKSILFEKPGIVRIYCDIHSYMNATVLVLENQYFATPTDDGTYQICGIPPGEYTLNFWFGRKIVEQRSVVIRAHETTRHNFDFAR